MSPVQKKLILVIGATGAQGLAVIDALLKPAPDGSPSPYAIRAFTRSPESSRAVELASKGVEIAKGSFDDFPSVLAALQGVYGAWVNTDGFTVGEAKELQAGMRIFELAKQVKSVRHFVWSNLDYAFKKGNYNSIYRCEHYDGKGRVAEWLKAQPSVVSDDDLSWTSVTTGPYMEMLKIAMFAPLNRRADGTYVFASPVGDGHVPMIALSDLGFFARYVFDNRSLTSAQDLEVATEMVSWDELVKTFTKVTGKKAVHLRQTLEEWYQNLKGIDAPIANERGRQNDGSTTWGENFSGWWAAFRDDILKRDMQWIRSIHPHIHTLESWMREINYTGNLTTGLLKNSEDGKSINVNLARLPLL
ncbi:NAD(P)-binding protein [Amylocystis lapponica]|nr:NAD(P)-binding protein [Amylocystis lapponica]